MMFCNRTCTDCGFVMTSFFEFSNSFFLCVLCWRKSTKNVTLHCLPFRQFHQHTLPPVANLWNRVVTSCLGVKISLNSFPVVLKEVSNRLTLRGCVTWCRVLLLKEDLSVLTPDYQMHLVADELIVNKIKRQSDHDQNLHIKSILLFSVLSGILSKIYSSQYYPPKNS